VNRQNQDIELRNVIAVLRRQARVIGYTFALIFGIATIFLISAVPRYTATGLVLVDPGTKNLLEPSQVYPSSSGIENAKVDSEVEILRSSAVIRAVIRAENLIADDEFGPRLGLSEKLGGTVGIAHAAVSSPELKVSRSLSDFRDAITIRRKGLTYLISVSVSSQSPEKAAELANSVARTYINRQVQAKISASLAARDVLQDQIDTAHRALSSSERMFDSFVARNIDRLGASEGGIDVAKLNTALVGIENSIKSKHRMRDDAQGYLATQSWKDLARDLGNEALLNVEAERRDLVNKLAEQPESSATASGLMHQIEAVEAELDRASTLVIHQFSKEIQKLEKSASGLREDIRELVLNAELPADLLIEIYAAQQDAGIARTQYQNLLSRLRTVETQSRIQIADSSLISPALAPIRASFPSKNLVLLLAFAASVGLGVSMAFLNEYYIGGVTSPNQLAELLQTPTAATIPQTVERNEQRLSIAEHVVDAPLSSFAESMRKLQVGVDLALPFRESPAGVPAGKIVLVTSALPAEGKTTTALALARTYALAGKKSLLIDADLRLPSVHRHLGFNPEIGILDFLRDPSDINISNTFYAKDPATPLALMLGAGRSDVPTDQLLRSATFEALLKQARDVYDVIVIDPPPVLPVVDARYIALHADAVVMMVKWATTSQTDLRAAVQPLREAIKPGTALLPVLGQQELRRNTSRQDGYYTGYSAAI